MAYLDQQAKKELLAIARTALEIYLSKSRIPHLEPASAILKRQAGAFVSLHRRGELRGCIGQITPDRELYRIVQSCALSAAMEDPRFSPVTEGELPELEIEISVLTPTKRVTDISEIQVGRHGLLITKGYRRGLLLPQVATRYNWSRETFLVQTCRKSGLPDNAWQDPSTTIELFEAEVFSEAELQQRSSDGPGGSDRTVQ